MGTNVAMPGPPREMRPMWSDEVLPRLRERGLGRALVARTFRLTGIGESQVAEIIGEEALRKPDPEIATYARLEAVDVRVSSSGDGAQERVDTASELVDGFGCGLFPEQPATNDVLADERDRPLAHGFQHVGVFPEQRANRRLVEHVDLDDLIEPARTLERGIKR